MIKYEDEETLKKQDEQLTEEQLMTQQIILEKDKKILELDKRITSMTNRALAVHAKNEQLMASPELAQRKAELEFDLAEAERFSRSKAFPSVSPEQIYTLIQAGKEMESSPIVSLNMLYVVNGHIRPYGDKMLGYILRHGFDVEYKNEVTNHMNMNVVSEVTVRIFNDTQEYIETAKSTDQIIIKSLKKNEKGQGGAASFALKNKLRFHAIRMIASFHLPHLFMGCSDAFSVDFESWKEGQSMQIKDKTGKTILVIEDEEMEEMIANTKDEEALDKLMAEQKNRITKSMFLTSACGSRRKFLESQNQ